MLSTVLQLYWKFTRTSVWIDHMDQTSAFLPPPFNIIHIVWGILSFLWYCTIYQVYKIRHKAASRNQTKVKCKLTEKLARERLEYVVLVLKLMERLLDEMVKGEHSALGGMEMLNGSNSHKQIKCFRQEVVNLKRKQICLLMTNKPN